jgi:hypothetical protein
VRYDEDRLIGMARVAVMARKFNDDRWLPLVLQVAVKAGMSPPDVMNAIEWMARQPLSTERKKETA